MSTEYINNFPKIVYVLIYRTVAIIYNILQGILGKTKELSSSVCLGQPSDSTLGQVTYSSCSSFSLPVKWVGITILTL